MGFHKFPKDRETRKKWTAKIGRENFDPDTYYLGQPSLCDDHFEKECFDKDPAICRPLGYRCGLVKGAVPTKFTKKRAAESPQQATGSDCKAKTPRRSAAVMKRQNIQVALFFTPRLIIS